MKITTLILLMALMQVSAASVAQRITFVKKNATLEQVFQEITRQTGYEVFYGDKKFDDSRKINVAFKDATLDEVLRACLQHQRASYVIEEKSIIIKPAAEPSFLERLADRWAAIDVHGWVVDQEGKPLPGATVKVKGTGKSVSANGKGEFYLENVEEGAVLVISFIGYVSKEASVKKEMGDVVLELGDNILDQVQVIAYGTTTKRLSAGNISSISAKEIESSPVSNPLLAIQGRVPGVLIQQNSGIAAASVNITVQGKNSFRVDGNSPFYVIDGIPYPQNDLPTTLVGAGTGTGLISALSFLNPSDIESIEILKDADATAIYGSRAANGAILITTKKGKTGKTKIDINLQNGWEQVAKKVKMLSTTDYLNLRKEGFANDGINLNIPPYNLDIFKQVVYPDVAYWDLNRYTDWQKELVGNTAQYTRLNASVSGGNNNTQFLAGGGYIKETTVYPTDFKDVKKSVHININHKSDNSKFQFIVTSSYIQDNNNLSNTDLMGAAINLSPNAPPLRNSDGSINWKKALNSENVYSFSGNPLAAIERKYRSLTNNLIGNSEIGYKILPHLELKTSLGYNRIQTEENVINPQSAYPPSTTSNLRGNNLANKYINSWIVEPQLVYNKEFLSNHIDALLGASLQSTDYYSLQLNTSGYTDDSQLYNIRNAPIISIGNQLNNKYRYSAIFARVNYRYKDRYILTVAARRDGTSRFGPKNLFANFYSTAGAWIFTEESFIKDKIPTLSYGKLRLSYGTTGSDQLPDYQFLSLYNPYTVDIPYQNVVGAIPIGHANPYLQWEKTRKLNFGLDLGFLKDRILLNTNYFINRSSNQLVAYPLPAVTGFGEVLRNISALIQNTGLELLLSATPIQVKRFSWRTSVNFSILRNKLIEFKNLETSTYSNQYVIGQPINIIKAFEYVSVNRESGAYEFRASDGRLTSAPNGITDNTQLINVNPKWFGGWSNSIDYRSFQLDFLLQFVKQNGRSNEYSLNGIPGRLGNRPEVVNNRWREPGDIAKYQKSNAQLGLNTAYDAVTNSTANYADASYIRLKNISFSYNLPNKLISKAGFNSARIYLQGQNVLTFSNYFGLDPETQSFGNLPPLRVYSLGVQVSL